MRFQKCFNATTLLGVWQFVEMFVMLVFKSLDCGFKCRECYVRSVVFLFYDNRLLNNSLSLLLIVIGCCCVQMYN